MLFCTAVLLQYDEREYKMMEPVFHSMFEGTNTVAVAFGEAVLPFSVCCHSVFCV